MRASEDCLTSEARAVAIASKVWNGVGAGHDLASYAVAAASAETKALCASVGYGSHEEAGGVGNECGVCGGVSYCGLGGCACACGASCGPCCDGFSAGGGLTSTMADASITVLCTLTCQALLMPKCGIKPPRPLIRQRKYMTRRNLVTQREHREDLLYSNGSL